MAAKERPQDWSPDQYLLFRRHRTRAIHDFMSFFGADYAPRHIVDLGCGPGNSTEVLAERFPSATITGVDSSPAMVAKARAGMPGVQFTQGDVRDFVPDPAVDLLFANAVFHWLRREQRISTITRLLQALKPGAVLAFQVPDNYNEPSHAAMREAAATDGPWREHFERLAGTESRPELDPIEPVPEWYNSLRPHCSAVEIWHTHYRHLLDDHGGIVEWVKGTGLQPFVNALPEGEARDGYLRAYRKRLEEVYPCMVDGKVMLTYPRLFVVAFR